MDKDIESQFDATDKLLAMTEKRIDDVKWFVGGIATLFTVIFSVFTIILSWNFINEKASLREYLRDLKADLGRLEVVPDLRILVKDGIGLDGKEVVTQVIKNNVGDFEIKLKVVLQNIGDGPAAPLNVKIYTKEPLRMHRLSTDELKYKFEEYIDAEDLDFPSLPGGKYTCEYYFNLSLYNRKLHPPTGKHDLMIKIYYGKGRVSQAAFTAVIPTGGAKKTTMNESNK